LLRVRRIHRLLYLWLDSRVVLWVMLRIYSLF
jgi:hypothetical protein